MRILGFGEKWSKLAQDKFTTFRFPRKDKDWQVDEMVQIVYKPRRKGGGEFIGVAKIINKEPNLIFSSNHPELAIGDKLAKEDGFENIGAMQTWMMSKYPLERLLNEPINKLTLRWMEPIW